MSASSEGVSPLPLPEKWDFKGNIERKYIGYLEIYMLFPDRVLQECEELFLCLTAKRIAENSDVIAEYSKQEISDAFKALTEERLSIKRKDVDFRFEQGALAGQMLTMAVGYDVRNEPISLEQIKDYWRGKYFKKDLSQGGDQGRKKIQRLWEKFRGVSHLWAAWAHLAQDKDTPFPCSVEHFSEFVLLSNEYLKIGKSVKLKQASKPVIHGEIFGYFSTPKDKKISLEFQVK